MASRGRTVEGTDGNDYSHRETVVKQYHVSAKNKSKLKWAVGFHFALGLLMAAKLLPAIMDILDIFVLEVEELFIPKPLVWEWVWLVSPLCGMLALTASKKSKIGMMRVFQFLVLATGLIPIVVGMATHFTGFWDLVGGNASVERWRGFPVALLWYLFFFVALQTHFMQLYLSGTLIAAWRPKAKRF